MFRTRRWRHLSSQRARPMGRSNLERRQMMPIATKPIPDGRHQAPSRPLMLRRNSWQDLPQGTSVADAIASTTPKAIRTHPKEASSQREGLGCGPDRPVSARYSHARVGIAFHHSNSTPKALNFPKPMGRPHSGHLIRRVTSSIAMVHATPKRTNSAPNRNETAIEIAAPRGKAMNANTRCKFRACRYVISFPQGP